MRTIFKRRFRVATRSLATPVHRQEWPRNGHVHTSRPADIREEVGPTTNGHQQEHRAPNAIAILKMHFCMRLQMVCIF